MRYILLINLIVASNLFFCFANKKYGALTYEDKFEVKTFAKGEMAGNPTSLNIDKQGRVYYADCIREYKGTNDTRRYQFWAKDEMAIQSLEDRKKMYEKWTELGKFKEGYFTEFADRVVCLIDSDADGIADQEKVYADGFNDALDGNGVSLLFDAKGDLYYANIPHIWRLSDKDKDGVSEKRESLLYGFGLRLGVSGHDLHGLTWGPDGRLYFSIGDRGYDVVSKEGVHFFDSERGAVFRCEPDGTKLERLTVGNRNPHDLSFDIFGNLFTVDNNRGFGDESRLYYVIEGGDYAWNSGYENKTTFKWALDFMKRPGPRVYDTWPKDGEWKMPYKGQPAFCIPSSGYIPGGSAGLTLNPGYSMGEDLVNHFLFSECQLGLISFSVKDQGAGFVLNGKAKTILKGGMFLDSTFANDGRLFVADFGWLDRKPHGNIYTMIDKNAKSSQKVKDSQKILDSDFSKMKVEQLKSQLSHHHYRVRQNSQFEFVRRGKASLALLKNVLQQSENELARLHALWALGQLSRSGEVKYAELLTAVKDESDHVRVQLASILGDSRSSEYTKLLGELLQDGHLRVRAQAAIALGKCGGAEQVASLIKAVEENKSDDAILRSALVTGLSYLNQKDKVFAYAKHASEKVRMASLLAMCRYEDARLATFLKDSSALIRRECLRAISRLNLDEARPAQAAFLSSENEQALKQLDKGDMYRLVQANVRLGDNESVKRLAWLIEHPGFDSQVKDRALFDLKKWATPYKMDVVDGQYRDSSKERAETETFMKPFVAKVIKDMDHVLFGSCVSMAGDYGLSVDINQIYSFIDQPKHSIESKLKTFSKWANGVKSVGNPVYNKLISHPSLALRVESLINLHRYDRRQFDKTVRENKVDLQTIYRAYASIRARKVPSYITKQMTLLLSGKHEAASEYDLVKTAGRWGRHDPMKKMLKQYNDKLKKSGSLGAWKPLAVGGNAKHGEKLVLKDNAGVCLTCHRINGQGGVVAPDLSDIGARTSSEYILESLVAPSAKIAFGFGQATLTLQDGSIVSGALMSEDKEQMQIKLADGSLKSVKKNQVKTTSPAASLMPAMGTMLKKEQIRDIVAYLKTLKTKPVSSKH